MPDILEILRYIFLGVTPKRKLKKIKRKIRKPLKKVRHRLVKHRKREAKLSVKLQRLYALQHKKVGVKPKIKRRLKPISAIKRIRIPIARKRRLKPINLQEVAEAFKLSASTIEKVYNQLKETEANIPKEPTKELDIDSFKAQVDDLEKAAADSGVSIVPEVIDLINYTKERIHDLELESAPESDPIVEARKQIEELEREKKHLEESQKVIEEKYYKREIDEVAFKKIMDDYEQRLVETDVKIKSWKKELAKLEKEAKLPKEKEKLEKIPKVPKLEILPRILPKLGFKLPKILRPFILPKPVTEVTEEKVSSLKIPKETIKEVITADIMTRKIFSVKPNDTLNYVVRLFSDKQITGSPVLKGNNLVGMISESDIVKFIGSKELLTDVRRGLKTLGEIKVQDVMHKNPVFIFEYIKLSEVTDLMNKYDVTRLPVLNDRRELVGVITRSDIMRGISKELLFKMLEGREIERIMRIETDIDEIFKIVERRGSISLGDIKKRLTLPEDKIEEWGKILEKHNLIELFYPPIGKPEFRKKIQ